ncbi:hypothetical protein [Deinococcus sonorensis]|uniref:Uncharacterized protein n=2 Tax=Deinococcus sonorensis TaxID=309891 RepID=A0AAU7UGC4_9DEIO
MAYANTCPLSQRQLLDEFFMEHRAQVLAIAAFLDRLDRSVDRNAEDDFRLRALRQTLNVLLEEGPERAHRVQLLLSDHTSELLEVRDQQGANGAPLRQAMQDGGEQ